MIVIACSDPKLVTRWSRALGGKYPFYTVSQKTALVRAISNLKPRLLILHTGFPHLRLGRELPAIKGLSPLTKILVLSGSPKTSEGVCALKAGARGYCGQNINSSLFRKAVKTVLQDELWAGHEIVTRLAEEMVADSKHEMPTARSTRALDGLSARKRQIADLVSQGATNKEIANRLNITEATVKSHLTAVFHRLQLSTRLQLALLAAAQTVVG